MRSRANTRINGNSKHKVRRVSTVSAALALLLTSLGASGVASAEVLVLDPAPVVAPEEPAPNAATAGTWSEMITAIGKAPTDGTLFSITLSSDLWPHESINNGFVIPTGTNILLQGNYRIHGSDRITNIIEVAQGAKLTLGSGFQGPTITGARVSGIYIRPGAEVILNSGVVGDIVNGMGGVFVSGSFTMNGGEITNNRDSGGLILAGNGAVATINGGVIADNVDTNESGGVYVGPGTTLNLNGGMITNNTGRRGGGIQVRGTVNMTGGIVALNHGESGAEIYFTQEPGHSAPVFNLAGGVVFEEIVRSNLPGNVSLSGNGIWINFDRHAAGGTFSVELDSTTYLTHFSALSGATAVWGTVQFRVGVVFSAGNNTGFIPVNGAHNWGVIPPELPDFIDVAPDSPFLDDINWLRDSGIALGWVMPDGGSEFRPGAPITREAMAAFLFRSAQMAEGSVCTLWPCATDFEPPDVPTFADVSADNVFYREIEWLAATGIASGWELPDGTFEFRPGTNVTREAMAAYLFRAAGSPGVDSESDMFTDVTEANRFFTEINWLAQVGITTGWPDGTFRPGADVTREAMAAFLHRAFLVGGGLWQEPSDIVDWETPLEARPVSNH